MALSATAARDAGHVLISQGYATPRRGTVRAAHVRTAAGTTLCNRTLTEPRRLASTGYLHGYNLCAACARNI